MRLVLSCYSTAALPQSDDSLCSGSGTVEPWRFRDCVVNEFACRMINQKEGNTLYDIRSRLRHQSIQTTERVYDHFEVV